MQQSKYSIVSANSRVTCFAYDAEKSGLVAKVFNTDEFDNSLTEIALKIANQSKPLAKLAKQAKLAKSTRLARLD